MKDKPQGKVSMQEVAAKTKKREPNELIVPKAEIYTSNDEVKTVLSKEEKDILDKQYQSRIDYNNNISDLDEDYKNYLPFRKILVRCQVKEPQRSEFGIIFDTGTNTVAAKTQSGFGYLPNEQSKYAFSRKAIVVALPIDYRGKLEVGDFITLTRGCTITTKAGKDIPESVPFAFFLPEWQNLEPPHDVNNKHFGYMLVSEYEQVEGFIGKEIKTPKIKTIQNKRK